MKRGDLQANWSGLSEEIMQGIAEWREQHSKATFREIEAEIDQRLSAPLAHQPEGGILTAR